MNIFLSGKSDRKSIAALVRCRSQDNEDLLRLFRQILEETKTALVTADGDYFRRLQGRAAALQDFLEAVDQSPQIYERMK